MAWRSAGCSFPPVPRLGAEVTATPPLTVSNSDHAASRRHQTVLSSLSSTRIVYNALLLSSRWNRHVFFWVARPPALLGMANSDKEVAEPPTPAQTF